MSCCGSLFVNLGGGGGGTVADGVLQTPTALTNSLQIVKDNLGNNSAAQLSKLGFRVNDGTNDIIDFLSAQIRAYRTTEIGPGSLTNNGFLTVKGAGSNILSLRDSSDVERGSFNNSGVFTAISFIATGDINAGQSNYLGFTGRTVLNSPSNGVLMATNNAVTDFTRLVLGTNDTSGASIVKNGTALQIKDGSAANFTTIEPLEILTQSPAGGTARKTKFGDKIAVTDGVLTVLGINTQWQVEINGTNFYFLGSTTQFS
jgi:hypothetical protein